MKQDAFENMMDNLDRPQPENIMDPAALKIPLLRYQRSSRAGLWLLVVPVIFAITVVVKSLGVKAGYANAIHHFFATLNNHPILTYLIPLLFVGLPLVAMIINFLSICHFQQDHKRKELLVTIKYRPLNIAIFLMAFAVLVFFLLPDKLAF